MQPYAHRSSSRKPRPSKPSTQKRTESRILRPKHYTALFRPRPRHNDNDGYTTASEEEIVSELDETALSKLPLHLQDNMREIHAERAHRLRSESRQRRPRYLYRHRDRLNEKPRSKRELKSSSQQEDKEYSTYYAETWFRKTLSKVAATRELEDNKVMEGHDENVSYSHHENMTWCPVRHEWTPIYYGQGRENGQEQQKRNSNPTVVNGGRSRAGSGASRLCGIGIGDREETPLSQAETVIAERYYVGPRHDCRTSSHSRYMSWRCAGPYYVYEAGASQDRYLRERRRNVLFSFISGVRNRVRTNIQQVKKMLK